MKDEAEQRSTMTLITPSDPAKKAKATGYYLLPAALRNFVRSRETGLVLVAIVIGLLSGLLVAAISKLSEVAHALLFDIPFDAHLSSTGNPHCSFPSLAEVSWRRSGCFSPAVSKDSNWPTRSRPTHSTAGAFRFAAAC